MQIAAKSRLLANMRPDDTLHHMEAPAPGANWLVDSTQSYIPRQSIIPISCEFLARNAWCSRFVTHQAHRVAQQLRQLSGAIPSPTWVGFPHGDDRECARPTCQSTPVERQGPNVIVLAGRRGGRNSETSRSAVEMRVRNWPHWYSPVRRQSPRLPNPIRPAIRQRDEPDTPSPLANR